MKPERHSADGLGWRLGPSKAKSLVVLLHGVGASAADLVPVAAALSAADAARACILLDGPEPFDGGGPGRQWFSIAGVTSDNRAERLAAALPALVGRLSALTAVEGVASPDLTVLGFSQGAMLTLGLAAAGHAFGRGVAFSGRLVGEVKQASASSPRLWLSHGAADQVIPISESRTADQRFRAAGFDTAFMPVENLVHTIAPTQLAALQLWLASVGSVSARVEDGQGLARLTPQYTE